MMGAQTAILILAGVVIVMAAALIVQLSLVARRFDRLVTRLEADLPPLITKAEGVVDGLEEQLARVESVVESAHNVSAKVHATTQGAQQILSSPVGTIISILSGLGRSRTPRS